MSDIHTAELSSQIHGFLVSLGTVSLFIVWSLETPLLIRYSITVAIAFLILLSIVKSMRRHYRLKKIRALQLKDYAATYRQN